MVRESLISTLLKVGTLYLNFIKLPEKYLHGRAVLIKLVVCDYPVFSVFRFLIAAAFETLRFAEAEIVQLNCIVDSITKNDRKKTWQSFSAFLVIF